MNSVETTAGHVYTRTHSPVPEPNACRLFDPQWLRDEALITRQMKSGRGTTTLFRYAERNLVLRPYHRGGIVRHLSTESFLWSGLQRTRPWLEFDLLIAMQLLKLPCPVPYACRVTRVGMRYTGALIMEEIAQSQSLAETLRQQEVPDTSWTKIGACIRRFHEASVYHSDLNANNILLDADGHVHLIDFDKSRFREGQGRSWKSANLKRLRRSITKCGMQAETFYFRPAQWAVLTAGYLEGASEEVADAQDIDR